MKRARTIVLNTMHSTRITTLQFPLTPALSLGEREKPSPPPARAMQVASSNDPCGREAFEAAHARRRLSPLPEGEGQGEGEWGFSTLPGATLV